MAVVNGARDIDSVLADIRALNERIEAEGRTDTERFIAMAEEANTALDEAEVQLGEVAKDFDAVESNVPPPGAEQIAAGLVDVKTESGL